MSSNLNNIFEQILQSELRAKKRREQLVEVKNQLELIHVKINKAKQKLSILQEQYASKIQTNSEEEVDVKLNEKLAEILSEQEHRILNEESNLETRLNDVYSSINTLRQTFCAKVREFGENNFVLGNVLNVRKVDIKKKLEQASKNITALKLQLQVLNDIQKNNLQLNQLKDENRQLTAKNNLLDEQIEVKNENLEKLNVDKFAINNSPNKNEEFQR